MIVNAVYCPKCNCIIYSRHVHDFHYCRCGDIAIDGGFDYIRVAFKKVPPLDLRVKVGVGKKRLVQDYARQSNAYGWIDIDEAFAPRPPEPLEDPWLIRFLCWCDPSIEKFAWWLWKIFARRHDE